MKKKLQDKIKLKWSEGRKEKKNKTDEVGSPLPGLSALTNNLTKSAGTYISMLLVKENVTY